MLSGFELYPRWVPLMQNIRAKKLQQTTFDINICRQEIDSYFKICWVLCQLTQQTEKCSSKLKIQKKEGQERNWKDKYLRTQPKP